MQETGEMPKALDMIDQAPAADPAFLMGWRQRGIFLHELGRHSEAAQSFGEHLRQDPDNTRAAVSAMHSYVRAGSPDRAVERGEAFMERVPEARFAEGILALAHLNNGAPDRCEKTLARLMLQNAGDPVLIT